MQTETDVASPAPRTPTPAFAPPPVAARYQLSLIHIRRWGRSTLSRSPWLSAHEQNKLDREGGV